MSMEAGSSVNADKALEAMGRMFNEAGTGELTDYQRSRFERLAIGFLGSGGEPEMQQEWLEKADRQFGLTRGRVEVIRQMAERAKRGSLNDDDQVGLARSLIVLRLFPEKLKQTVGDLIRENPDGFQDMVTAVSLSLTDPKTGEGFSQSDNQVFTRAAERTLEYFTREVNEVAEEVGRPETRVGGGEEASLPRTDLAGQELGQEGEMPLIDLTGEGDESVNLKERDSGEVWFDIRDMLGRDWRYFDGTKLGRLILAFMDNGGEIKDEDDRELAELLENFRKTGGDLDKLDKCREKWLAKIRTKSTTGSGEEIEETLYMDKNRGTFLAFIAHFSDEHGDLRNFIANQRTVLVKSVNLAYGYRLEGRESELMIRRMKQSLTILAFFPLVLQDKKWIMVIKSAGEYIGRFDRISEG